MRWCEAYIQMKEKKAFVKRKFWGQRYMVWLKPVFFIQEEWCKDENLKKLINVYGDKNEEGKKILKGEESLCLFTGHSVEQGWQPIPEDKVAEDWEIVEF